MNEFFHGIEHMTRDHDGYVYYKGFLVDHYRDSWANSIGAKHELIKLKDKCEFFDFSNVVFPISSVKSLEISDYDKHKFNQFRKLLSQYGENAGVAFSSVTISDGYGQNIQFLTFPTTAKELFKTPIVKDFIAQHKKNQLTDSIQITTRRYHVGGREIVADRRLLRALDFCFDYLKKEQGLQPINCSVRKISEAKLNRMLGQTKHLQKER